MNDLNSWPGCCLRYLREGTHLMAGHVCEICGATLSVKDRQWVRIPQRKDTV